MPRGTNTPDELSPIKALIIGDTKAGKTDYVLRAAEAGFNVILIDGDVATQCLKAMAKKGRLSQAALDRIFIFRVPDYMDNNGNYEAYMADFFVKFCTAGVFRWNDTLQRQFDLSEYKPDEGHVVWEIKPSRIGIDTLLVVDSWTALVTSVLNWKAESLGEDLGDMEKVSRDMYAGSGHKMNHFLQLLRSTPCHLAVISHPREYVKLEKPKGKIGSMKEADMKIEWTKMVPTSTSNPHALTIGKNFSDIGWIEISPMGKRTIDFKATDGRVSGGHLDIKGDADELSFAKLVEHQGMTVPKNPSTESWLKEYGPGEFEVAAKATLAKKPLLGGVTPKATPGHTVESVAQELAEKIANSAAEVESGKPAPVVAVKGLGSLMALKASGVER